MSTKHQITFYDENNTKLFTHVNDAPTTDGVVDTGILAMVDAGIDAEQMWDYKIKPIDTAVTQETMQQLHDIINNLTTQYINGLLTNIEFAHAAHAATKFIEGADLTGLIDVNTGLKY